jgi:predicted Zn-dependent peptidase
MMFNRTFTEEALVKEKLVVLEEERGYRDDIDVVIAKELNKFLCTGPLSKPVLGTVESISSITLKEVQEFYYQFYRPANMLVTITGPSEVDWDCLKSFIGKDTGRFRRFSSAPNKHKKQKRLTSLADIQQARTFICYNACPIGGKDGLVLQFMSRFFSNGMDSRLFEELRQKQGLCYGVGSIMRLKN